ncbi:winged helix-turn-helix domain-containing protein [Microbacterium thalli]|uniref:Winged helix-turn-helix domain-containing protein n=1 Tax=Microbacterium thalli TaxID=3027921 RepID=A0ABT5SL52_9MICO|nr:winged helix-turn-helix domain-containing protein [Microbacterium thalli]MDD7929898.1 winged helix-turn-helix domain-containing protein [Microbacterium thalli]MDD7963565.1 winged helix-turn-helix domain-containing protein [Microbacterium thalli]MDN8549563.1 winged helix-turn-helix domain-containing protein [Microbacterium thalli]
MIVLAPDTTAVRGTMAEFRHFGVSLVVKTDILAALTELVHDPMAVIVVSSEIPCQDTADVLDLAVATCRSAVLFGLHPSTPTAAVSRALTAGVRGVIELPVTPERLTHTLRSVPTAPSNAPGEVSVGDLRIDVGRHLVQLRDAVVPTTPREFDVLLALATSYPGMVSLSELADRHGSGADPYASVRVVIARLRTRFAQLAGVPRESVIATQRGIGYRLAA